MVKVTCTCNFFSYLAYMYDTHSFMAPVCCSNRRPLAELAKFKRLSLRMSSQAVLDDKKKNPADNWTDTSDCKLWNSKNTLPLWAMNIILSLQWKLFRITFFLTKIKAFNKTSLNNSSILSNYKKISLTKI